MEIEETLKTIKLLKQHYNGSNTLQDEIDLLKLLRKQQDERSINNYDMDEMVSFNTGILEVVVAALEKLSKNE